MEGSIGAARGSIVAHKEQCARKRGAVRAEDGAQRTVDVRVKVKSTVLKLMVVSVTGNFAETATPNKAISLHLGFAAGNSSNLGNARNRGFCGRQHR